MLYGLLGFIYYAKMESILHISLYKVDILRKFKIFEFAALYVWDCSSKLMLFLQAKESIAGNSNIFNILRMSTLQGKIILNPFWNMAYPISFLWEDKQTNKRQGLETYLVIQNLIRKFCASFISRRLVLNVVYIPI